MIEPDGQPVHIDDDWREGLLARVRIVVILLMGFAGLVAAIWHGSQAMQYFGICLVVSAVILFPILSSKRITVTARAVIAVVALSVAVAISYTIAGYLPGGALAGAYTLVIAALFLGRNAYLALLAVLMSIVILLIVAVRIGAWEGPAIVDFDPGLYFNWIRTSFVTFVIWISLGASVLFVVNAIERNAERGEQALAEKLSLIHI